MIFEMVAIDTLDNSVKLRNYTTSYEKANRFRKIPLMKRIDDVSGIVFRAREYEGEKLPKLTPYIIGGWIKDHVK